MRIQSDYETERPRGNGGESENYLSAAGAVYLQNQYTTKHAPLQAPGGDK
jgi:hypothetical protein